MIRHETWFLYLLVAVATLYAVTVNDRLQLESDEVLYLQLGRSLVRHGTYAYSHLLGQPVHKRLPPLFPVMLAPLAALPLGLGVALAKAGVAAFGIGTLVLLRRSFSAITRSNGGPPVVACLCCSYYFAHYSHLVRTEIPYLFLSALVLLCFTKLEQDSGSNRRLPLLAGLALGCTILTRTIGVALLAALVAFSVLEPTSRLRQRQDWRTLAWVIAAAVVLPLLWAVRNATCADAESGGGTYLFLLTHQSTSATTAAGSGIGGNPWAQGLAWGSLICSLPPADSSLMQRYSALLPLVRTVELGVAGLVLSGYFWALRHRRTMVEYYVAFYLGIVLSYGFPEYALRFAFPLLPWLINYLLIGVVALLRPLSKGRAGRWIPAALICLFGAAATLGEFFPKQVRRQYEHKESDFVATMHSFAQVAPANAVLFSDVAHTTALFTERLAAFLPDQPRSLTQSIAAAPGGRPAYVVLDPWMSTTRRDVILQLLSGRTLPPPDPVTAGRATAVYAVPR